MLVTWWQRGIDRVAGSDPGFNRLIVATRGALTIALALAGEYLFVRGTGALEAPTPPHPTGSPVGGAVLQHHDALVVAMLLGGLVALMTALNVNDRTLLAQAVTLTYIPAALIASLALGLWLGPHRAPALVVMVVLLTAGAYGRRFGPRGVPAGILLFLGYFNGFFLSPTLGVSDLGWLAAEVMVAVLAAAVVRVVAFRPSASTDLRRALRSYEARVRRVTTVALDLLDRPDARRRRTLQRWQVRLDEAALIVEGNLADPRAVEGATAVRLRQWLFDVELALTNATRFVALLAPAPGQPATDGQRLVGEALAAVADGDRDRARRAVALLRQAAGPAGQGTDRDPGGGTAPTGPDDRWRPATVGAAPSRPVVLHRYATAIEVLADAVRPEGDRTIGEASVDGGLSAPLPARPDETAAGPFDPVVTLQAGRLPGTSEVSSAASTGPGAQVRLAPYLRTTAQVTVAVSVAIVAGSSLDASRFYWAVVAALLALVGTNTVAEQLLKAAERVVGTLAGVVAGTALVDAVGTHSIWSLVVVVTSLWLGMYLFRVNYAFMAMAITVALSQAYFSLGEFSGGLLTVRLEETAVGAGAAMLTVLLVLPLHTRRVLDVATADLVDALVALADAGAAALRHPGAVTYEESGEATGPDLRAAGRRVDAAYQALVATAEPLRMVSWADVHDRVAHLLAAATAARNYGRNLAFDVEGVPEAVVDAALLDQARRVLTVSSSALAARLRGSSAERMFTRAGALLGAAEREVADPSGSPSPTVLVLRDLALVDGTLATIARGAGMDVRTLDDEVDGSPLAASVHHVDGPVEPDGDDDERDRPGGRGGGRPRPAAPAR